MQGAEFLIEARDVCKNFGVTVALDHVSFGVRPGEIRGLIGEMPPAAFAAETRDNVRHG